MSVTGSSLINVSTNGLPTDTDDRPFSFAIGTQIFLNPPDDPTDAIASFKFNPDLVSSTTAAGLSTVAIGLATDSQLDNLASATANYIGTANGDSFPIGFCRLNSNPDQVGINAEGSQIGTLSRSTQVASADVDISSNTFTINGHSFETGDRVLVTSTGTVPGGLSSVVSYFIIKVDANNIKFATSFTAANSGTEIDIQTTGSGTITVAPDEVFTITRLSNLGVDDPNITLKKGDTTIFTFSTANKSSPLRLFYWCREQSVSNSLPIFKEIKVRGAL